MSNEQINQKFSNHLWGSLRQFWCTNYTNLKLPTCLIHGKPPKEHLLATNISQPQLHILLKPWNWHVVTHILHLYPPTHKRPSHRPTQQSNLPNSPHTPIQQTHKCYILVNVGNQHNWPQDITNPEWSIQCTCLPTTCACMAQLRPGILCVLGPLIAIHPSPPPFKPIKHHTIHTIHLLLW